jgi:hypothetical protein
MRVQAPPAVTPLAWAVSAHVALWGQFTTDVICSVSRNSSGNPILFLPSSNSGSSLPKDPLDILKKIAVNVVHTPDNSTNELPDILRGWFGKEVGTPGRGDRVRFHKEADTIVMEPFGPSLKSGR